MTHSVGHVQITTLQRYGMLLAGGLLITAAAALLITGGLPAAETFMGRFIAGEWTAPVVGARAPAMRLQALSDGHWFEAPSSGKITIVNFWATWCVPCEIEMPELQALQEAYADRGVHVLAVNLGEDRATIAPWLAERGLTLDAALDPDGSATAEYALRGQPSTFVVDRQGYIRAVFLGATTRSQLEAVVQPLL